MSVDSIRMTTESTAGAEALLERVAALGWPEIGRSTAGAADRARGCSGADETAGQPSPLVVMAGIHGDEPASVEAVLDLLAHGLAGRGGWGHGPLWVVPALNPDGLPADRKNSARDVDLNRNFPARNFDPAHPPGYHPGPAPAARARDRRPSPRLVETVGPWGVVAVHAPFACINYDGPAAGLGRGGGRSQRLAGAGGHRLPDARLAGQLAGGGPAGCPC